MISAIMVLAFATYGCLAEANEGQDPKRVVYMFVQTADSGTLIPVEGEENLYHLTLEGVAGNTTYFSDRPERIVGQAPMEEFLSGLGFSPENPPNAALEMLESDGSVELVVLELFEPAYHSESNTLEYTASILEQPNHSYAIFNERHDNEVPQCFNTSALFIDDCSDKNVKCMKSDGSLCGWTTCCTCWSFGDLFCGFNCDSCTASRCDGNCKKKFGSACRYRGY
jgi:hypothetical protein